MQELVKQYIMKNKIRITKSDNSFAAVNNPFIWILPLLIIPQLIMRSTKGYPLTENPLFWMVVIVTIISIILSVSVRKEISCNDIDILKVLESEIEYFGEINIYSNDGFLSKYPTKKHSVDKAIKHLQREHELGRICEIEVF